MKNIIKLIAAVAVLFLLALTTPAFAKDVETITGEGKCAKCALHVSDKCQNVIETQKDGKTVTYFLAPNTVSKDFHSNVCKESKKVTATGTVKEKDGKMVLTAKTIELAK